MRRYIVSVLAIVSLAFTAAVAAGDYENGRAAYDIGDFEKALAIWAPAAESGDTDSQYGMGLLYSEGIAVPTTVTFFERSIRRISPDSTFPGPIS